VEKEMNLAENGKHNPKKFYSYIQSKTKTRTSIPDLYIDSDKKTLTSSDSEKANFLADLFSSVFTEEGANIRQR
jgi:hypothetical protein